MGLVIIDDGHVNHWDAWYVSVTIFTGSSLFLPSRLTRLTALRFQVIVINVDDDVVRIFFIMKTVFKKKLDSASKEICIHPSLPLPPNRHRYSTLRIQRSYQSRQAQRHFHSLCSSFVHRGGPPLAKKKKNNGHLRVHLGLSGSGASDAQYYAIWRYRYGTYIRKNPYG